MNPSRPAYPRRILFVCTGNTCRSPMAEGIMKHLLPGGWKEKIRVESAGTMQYGGFPSSELAIGICAARGIDIAGHVSRELNGEIVADADTILVMEHRHLARVEELGGEGKVFLVTDYPAYSGRGKEVRDPIGLDPEVYGEVFEELEREIAKIVRHLTGSGGDAAG